MPAPATHPYRAHLDEAMRRLRAHVADPSAVAADAQAIGPRVRVVTWVFLGLALACLLIVAAASDVPAALIMGSVFGGILGLCGLILLAFDLTMVKRDEPNEPDKVLKSFFRALAQGRNGYAFACLCPTAREQQVTPPQLGPVAVTPGPAMISGTRAAFSKSVVFNQCPCSPM